ncbi:MAG: flagellar protein FliS [Terracidiphilus sp.]
MSPTEMAYRKTALSGASGFGLLIALYDTLASDLRCAAEAERQNDIEMRCERVNHALLVIAYLEDWINRGPGGELGQQLLAFYATFRRKMIEAQAKRSAEIMEQQMAQVLDIRAVWQGIEDRQEPSKTEVPAWVHTTSYPGGSPTMYEQGASRWSA